ncbi:RHS repeat-associated core domain-containing protein [Chryseobacterium scophthalmum]|uniref:RHS repeat-associated core domain-containing protein n=1 Tax=Chryseobacterium scophthalmum TaxID=59733 RepID=UPI00398ADC53
MTKLYIFFISILVACTLYGQNNFHDTQGKIEVNAGGQLQYTLPIAVPPGVKNVSPNISLMYLSNSNNGIAGYGWTVSGLTAITRTSKNIEKDGELKAVQLDYSDYYSFNGQRLILAPDSPATYGQDGATYVTEKYSSIKIKSLGVYPVVGGPAQFEITFEDGSQAWYGAFKTGSRVSHLVTTPLEYNIVKWKDSQGNYITYDYVSTGFTKQGNIRPEEGVGTVRISTISWGGNETLNKPHFNTISFVYLDRDLKEQTYIQGIGFTQNKILSEIHVRSNGSQFKKYTIDYVKNGTNYQFVNQITEYNANNEPANPVVFSYPNRTGTVVAGANFGSESLNNVRHTGDFNGDSYIDFIMPNGIVKLGAFNENFTTVTTNKTFNLNAVVVSALLDEEGQVYNGNGIVQYMYDKVEGYIFRNNIFVKVFEKTITPTSCTSCTITFNEGDVNGDGISDLLLTFTNTANSASQDRFIIDLKNPNNPHFTYSGDGSFSENSYTDQKYMDVDGDGKVDIINISDTSYTVFEFVKTSPTQYLKKIKFTGNLAETKGSGFPVLFGDFNGDGKLDFTLPLTEGKTGKDDWRFYINKGNGFNTFRKNDFLVYKNVATTNNGYWLQFSKTFYSISDINADGKSDIVQVYSYSNSSGSSYRSIGVTVNSVTSNGTVDTSNGDIDFAFENIYSFPSPGTFTLVQPYDDLSIYQPITNTIRSNNNYYNVFLFRKDNLLKIKAPTSLAELTRIKSISQAGITTSVEYFELNPDVNSNYYKKIKKEYYPFFSLERADQSFAVLQLKQAGRKQDFRYRGMTGHFQGKGIMGFLQSARSTWYADGYENTKIWSGVEIDPQNDGVPVKEWTIRTNDESKIFPVDISENNTQLLSYKKTIYQTDKLLNGQVVNVVSDADRPKIVTAIVPKNTLTKDFLTNTVITGSINYEDHYLPSNTVSTVNGNFAVKTTTYKYLHNSNGVANNYYVGRPESKTETAQAYNDTKSSKEEYTYENNLLKTSKAWNNDNTNYLLNTYSYDGFGNIIQKLSTNSEDNEIITEKSQYEPKGRFVEKRTNNLGLETLFTYNNAGQTLTNNDPFGSVITNSYDNWGKLLSSNSSINGTILYTYEKLANNGGTKISQFTQDGDVKITYTNILGQNYKNSTKGFTQGTYISTEIQYDILGRKWKESEPYFEGQNVSQWNIFEYDDSIYPTKLTATSFIGKKIETSVTGTVTTIKELTGYARTNTKVIDALGNVIQTTDKGGTISFSYNAAQQQIEAKYGNNTVLTNYDSWGRKSSFHDPANGLYEYEYTGFGIVKKEKSPKGYKEYNYSPNGLLSNVRELSNDGVSTEKNYDYKYNTFGQIIVKSGYANGKYFEHNFSYDNNGRLKSDIEDFEKRRFYKKNVMYDALGRISQYTQGLESSGNTTEVTINNNYSTVNGDLESITDTNSGKVLWLLQDINSKGQVLTAKLGNTQISNQYNSFGFLAHTSHTSNNANLMTLTYDFDAIKNELNTRFHQNFNINENFKYDDNNRLIDWTNPKTGQMSYNQYDNTGRITHNDQLGDIGFSIGGSPYRVMTIKLNAQGVENYDMNGQSKLLQQITYNENNDPVKIDGTRGDYDFGYGLSENRQIMYYGGNFKNIEEALYEKYYSESGDAEIIIDRKNGKEKHILYVGGIPYDTNVIFIKNVGLDEGSYKFLHKDYLGSILAISNENGDAEERRHYDAWGIFTHLQIKENGILVGKEVEEFIQKYSFLTIDRGYTSHEHLYAVELIHMNGRLYDPLLRRFLNADENIQDPTNTQSYNKYGYVINNPLMYNDPSGEIWAAGFFLSYVVPVIYGAIIGAVISGSIYIIKSLVTKNWSWSGFGKSLLIGAVTGAISGGISATYTATGFNGAVVMGSINGGLGGGVDALLNGKNFATGFYKGGIIGGVVGAVSWGVNEMVVAARITKTTRLNHEYKAVESDVYNNPHNYSNEQIDYSLETIEKFQDSYGGLRNHGVETIYNRTPEGYGLAKNNLFYKKNFFENLLGGARNYGNVLGVTPPGYDIYLSPGAYASKSQFVDTITHETGHVIFNKAGVYSLANQATTKMGDYSGMLDDLGHVSIRKMSTQLFNKNPWLTLSWYIPERYFYNSNFELDKLLLPLIKYFKF